MAEAKKKKKPRQKRQLVIAPPELLAEAEQEFAEAIQSSEAIRETVFDDGSQHSIDDLAEYFIKASAESKTVFCH